MAQRKNRLARELEMLSKDPPPGITARVVVAADKQEGEGVEENSSSVNNNKEQSEGDVRISVT